MRIFTGIFVAIGLMISVPALADSDVSESLLNKVSLQLNSEQWVATKTALVTIGISASVPDAGLDKVQDTALKKLEQLSNKGDWHIVYFNRTLDQSGLENIQMRAEARLPAAALPNLRDKSKEISKPGETFTLENVQFTPSEQELRDANIVLRNQIYQQAKEELDRVNKMYPDQKYYMHDINFINNVVASPMPQISMMAINKSAGSSPLAVGDKMILNATVVFAAMPDPALMKMIR